MNQLLLMIVSVRYFKFCYSLYDAGSLVKVIDSDLAFLTFVETFMVRSRGHPKKTWWIVSRKIYTVLASPMRMIG